MTASVDPFFSPTALFFLCIFRQFAGNDAGLAGRSILPVDFADRSDAATVPQARFHLRHLRGKSLFVTKRKTGGLPAVQIR
ncbi:MAG: hypothetical protein KGK15_07125 [Burkholderiales bacterium]|nr:hypothetical protein [Burkholderiales bacterium]